MAPKPRLNFLSAGGHLDWVGGPKLGQHRLTGHLPQQQVGALHTILSIGKALRHRWLKIHHERHEVRVGP